VSGAGGCWRMVAWQEGAGTDGGKCLAVRSSGRGAVDVAALGMANYCTSVRVCPPPV
jgi:hypothetical protein